MSKITGKVARRLVAVGFPLALLLLLIVSWTVWAELAPAPADGSLVQYQISLGQGAADRLEVVLPVGFEYVGLAPGSQVSAEPEIAQDGRSVVWSGPFSPETVLRFWIAPLGSAVAPASLAVVGADVEAVPVDPLAAVSTQPDKATAIQGPADQITVTKSVEPEELEPGDSRWVIYEVVFTSVVTEPVLLERITDTLPAGFLFGGMAYGSEVGEPADATEPDIVWEMVTVPASSTLTLRYYARAGDQSGVFENSVRAVSGGELIGPASATLTIEMNRILLPVVLRSFHYPAPVWQLTKTVDSTEVAPGEAVNYTVQIANTGDRAGTLITFQDTLPAGFTFLAMQSGSDVVTPPSGTTGTISWSSSWILVPGDSLTLIYQVQTGGSGEKINTVTAFASDGSVAGTASSSVVVGMGLPFQDDFVHSALTGWEPFLNWPGLSPALWSWSGEEGAWGLMNYDLDAVSPAYTGYNLFIYNDPGAQSWTDYRVEVRLKDVKEYNQSKGFAGVWFRGTYQDSGAGDGKTAGGYYVYMKAGDEHLYLMRTPPDDPSFASQTVVGSYYFAPGIGRKHWYKIAVQVQGNRIQVWFEDDEDGVSNPVLAFDWTDTENVWPSGTVGLAAYNTAARFDYIYVLPLD
jgi:uncharacterized repeat protein (TIGR01451 family)